MQFKYHYRILEVATAENNLMFEIEADRRE